jgi:hypothetical protein
MSIESHLTRRQAFRAAGALDAVGAASSVLPSWLVGIFGPGTAQAASKCAKPTPDLTEARTGSTRCSAAQMSAGVLLPRRPHLAFSRTACR